MKIDRNIPPPTGGSAKKGYAAVLRSLKPDESVFIPGKTTVWASRYIHVLRREAPERRFTSRRLDGGVRIWRLDDDLLA